MPEPLLDTNILLRHFLQDHESHSPRATGYLERVRAGEVVVRISDAVITETVFTLERRYRYRKANIREAMQALLDDPGVLLTGKDRWRRILDIYVDYNISLGDAEQVELMERLHLTEIVTFDTDFDRVPGIVRIEP